MQNPFIREHRDIFLIASSACIVLGFIQTAHFYFYFETPLAQSVKWSVKGSLIWLCIFSCVVYLVRPGRWAEKSLATEIAVWSFLALLCGALQVFIAVFMDFLLGTASRPLFADFEHLYSKRFIQNTSIAGLFLSWWRFSSLGTEAETATKQVSKQELEPPSSKLQITDGAQTRWLEVAEISHVEALGNYVCIHHDDRQHIVRQTLTALAQRLENQGFVRISRSVIVNRQFIKSCSRINKNRMVLETTGKQILSIGRTYQHQVKELLNV
ncbi:MAG: LytTR family DNA-binding domain-containing protein [Pseudomonadota bacterium]